MKTYSHPRRSKGFTLVELLVVITIIAVLAALSFAGVNLAIKKARKTEGMVAATSLTQAIENFYGEYNRLPDVGGTSEIKTDGGTGQQLLEILTGAEKSSDDMENPRSIVFFSGKEAKGRKGGLEYQGNSSAPVALWDPFGQPFTVVLNSDYADALEFQFASKRVTLRGQQAAVYSAGGDKEQGTTDDIISWK